MPLHTFFVDTQNLSPEDRVKVVELLDIVCFMNPIIWGKNPYVYVAHTERSADEFAAIPFPDGCVITDKTGQNLDLL